MAALYQSMPRRKTISLAGALCDSCRIFLVKFHQDTITSFRPQIRYLSDTASFFGSSVSLQPRPLHRFSRSIHQMTSYHARMCLLGVPKTKFYISTPSPKKANFWQFSTGVKKALTMKMLESKLPLIVIVAPWKLYRELGSSITNMGSSPTP